MIFETAAGRAWLDHDYGERGGAAVAEALDAVTAMPGGRAVEVAPALRAWAAAEVVAAAHGRAGRDLEGLTRSAVMGQAGQVRELPNVLDRALSAVARIWAETSLLVEERGDDLDPPLTDLTNRLSAAERSGA